MPRILVAYATKTGSTKAAAEEIQRVLAKKNFDAEVRPMSEIKSLDGYDGIVVGAPINGMKWLPEATAFVLAHKAEMCKVPVAYFLMSYLLFEGGSGIKATIQKSLVSVQESVPTISTGMFPGKLEKAMPLFLRLLFGVKNGRPLDITDMPHVSAWASDIAGMMRSRMH